MNYTAHTIRTEYGIITVHKPILTDSERKKREQEVVSALVRFGKETEKR